MNIMKDEDFVRAVAEGCGYDYEMYVAAFDEQTLLFDATWLIHKQGQRLAMYRSWCNSVKEAQENEDNKEG